MSADVLLKVRNIKKWFPTGGFPQNLFSETKYIKAVDGVSFDLYRQEILGIIGESGSGKTTLVRTILRLINPTDGKAYFEGRDIFSLNKKELKSIRREMQIVFQDPYSTLSERMNAYDIVREPTKFHDIKGDINELIKNAFEAVSLNPPSSFFKKYPHELSGGQRQRIAVARALVLHPKLLIADEPVSMIDISLKVGFLNLLLDLREKIGLTCLFITHDISLARYLCNRIATMYLGVIVEMAPSEEMIMNPLHPYNKALISVVPTIDPVRKHAILLKGEIPNPINLPSGCRFHPRCQHAIDICRSSDPELVEVKGDHYVACHLCEEINN